MAHKPDSSIYCVTKLVQRLAFGFATASILIACAEREYEFKTVEEGGDKPDGSSATVDARMPVDMAIFVPRDAAIRLDACATTGQPEICNGLDDDCNGRVDDVASALLDRTESCGSCDSVCTDAPNSTPICNQRKCGYGCVQGAIDIDKSAINGCECILIGADHDAAGNKNEALCDGRDNDCDGKTDEGFDKKNDLSHCGGCNANCAFPFALAACTNGTCNFVQCRPGFYDRDPKALGCETACVTSNGGAEICDGVDNDCNGQTDEPAAIAAGRLTCRQGGVCGAAQAVCMGTQGWVCPYPASFRETEDQTGGCDGLDNDCDGLKDEAFLIEPPTPCRTPNSVLGECARDGFLRCNAAMTAAECGAMAGTARNETCDGLDNDCDGKTDELLSKSDRTSDEQTVFLPNVGGAQGVTIFIHEAGRVDANALSAGFESGKRACSSPNKLPWSDISKEDATAACGRIGTLWRLCTGTEWVAACQGGAMRTYPYSNTFDAEVCNGANHRANRIPAKLPTGTAASPGGTRCVADTTVWDLSGNVKEWTTTTANGNLYELRGGAYNTATLGAVAPGLRCDAVVQAPDTTVLLPSVGFRCCRTGDLPQ